MNDPGGAGRWAWPALAAVLILGSVVTWLWPGSSAPGTLDWQPALAPLQPWRAWTAAFVHLSSLHFGANLAGTLLVAALGRAAGCDARATLAWAAAWPITHLGLAMQPQLLHFGGLSGVLHAGVAVAAVRLIVHERGMRRAIGTAIAVGLVTKLMLEAPWGAPTRQVPGWDIPLAPLAHATGAFAGALLGFAAAWHRPSSTVG